MNQIASLYLSEKNYSDLILFLTGHVSRDPSDVYNSYWLLMTAYACLSTGAEPFAEYYLDKILREYPDLLVKGESIHYLCLKNLARISKTPRNRIKYFTELCNRFPDNVSVTELLYRLALERQKENDWEAALGALSAFLARSDSSTIQIAGEPDAYSSARQIVDFYNSPKDWTFDSLEDLERTVRSCISRYDWRALDRLRSKVGFFSMSWNQTEMDSSDQEDFSIRNYMRGQRISCAPSLEAGATPNEAYLRTWGWSQYVSVWYLYFRKVNFPVDPEFHGDWEWAGIYIGDKF